MLQREIETELPPEYHDDLLIVRFQPDLANIAAAATVAMPAMVAMAGSVAVETSLATPAAAIAPSLLSLDKLGFIRRVTPLLRSALPPSLEVSSAVLSTFSSTGAPRIGNALLSGTAIVELEHGVDADEAAKRVGSDAQVQFVSRVPLRYMMLPVRKKTTIRKPTAVSAATPPPLPGLWNLLKIEWAAARSHAAFVDADEIKVAVLDTGVDDGHPDLAVSGYVFDHPDTPQLSTRKDYAGHGTHVAGIVAATIGNAVGVHGICRCRLMCWKIFNDQPKYIPTYGKFIYVVDPIMYQRALADCLDESIDVINLSIGGTRPPDPQEKQLLNALLANGTTIVAAMGNHRRIGSPTSYPAAVPDVIAVGATSIDDSVATFSNRGDHITVSAPGTAIWSTMPTYEGQTSFEAVTGSGGTPKEGKAIPRETNYAALDGTSMATPHVTGAVALLLAKRGKMAPSHVASELKHGSDRVSGMGGSDFHPDYGAGRLNLNRLL